MKKEAVHAPGLTMAEGITRLHDEMSDLVGNDMNVNIEQDGERLIFRLWKCHRWGELTLYYFPVKFVENLGPELRRISVTFIHNLMQANGIDTILDEDDTEYALTWLAEENDDEQDDRKKQAETAAFIRERQDTQSAQESGTEILLQGPAEGNRTV